MLKAPYDGRCYVCGEDIYEGDDIDYFETESDLWVHIECAIDLPLLDEEEEYGFRVGDVL